jgi:hypothetical protein
MKSSVTVYLLNEDYMREFYGTLRADRVSFVKTKWKEMWEGKQTYRLTAGWVVDATGEEAAEEVFDMTNNPSRQEERNTYYEKTRSVSVGDIVEVTNGADGKQIYFCDSFGWVAI